MRIGGLLCRSGSLAVLAVVLIFCSLPGSLLTVKTTAGERHSAETAELFRDGTIPQIHIEIREAGMAALRKYRWKWGGNDDERVAVRATVKEGKTIYTSVALRLKGAAGSFRPVDQNPGLSLNFDKWADGQRFHG